MASVTWTHNYTPRSYFKPFHARTQQFACLVIHRRGGKTHAVINDMIGRALRTRKKNWRGAYIAPVLSQAIDAAWQPLMDAVADLPGIKISKSRHSVTFPNGSYIRLYSADNPETIRGGYFDYACLDEYGDIHPTVLGNIILPMTAGRRGSIVVIGTPKGKNHFYKRAMLAESSDKWLYIFKDINDTGTEALSLTTQQNIREELEDPEWNQEMLCSWTAEFRGAFYAKELEEVRARNAVGDFPYVIGEKVHAAMDIGRGDATAVWFWQYVTSWDESTQALVPKVRFIDYFEETGLYAAKLCEILHLKPYDYEAIYLPHDAKHETFASEKSVLDQFIASGLPARKVPNPDKGHLILHGINAVRTVLREWPIEFNQATCSQGLESLANYSRKYDVKTQTYANKPNHDHWSHGADGFRYTCLALNKTDLGRSLERALAAAKRASRVNKNASSVTDYTFNEALRHHDRQMAFRRRNAAKVNY